MKKAITISMNKPYEILLDAAYAMKGLLCKVGLHDYKTASRFNDRCCQRCIKFIDTHDCEACGGARIMERFDIYGVCECDE